jgi:membrane associated rhomboid family serine protease
MILEVAERFRALFGPTAEKTTIEEKQMFFLPLFDENNTDRRPVITWLIMIACITCFLWQKGLDPRLEQLAIYQFGFIPSTLFEIETLPPDLVVIPAWVTIFTSMFLHGGWLHIAGNMLYLWIFGDNVENAMGPPKFIIFYLLCGLSAALAQAAIDPSSTVPMIGASGGIAGILGAYLILHPKASVRCFLLILIFVRFINLPAWLVLGIWIGGQFVAVPQALASDGAGVAYMAHIGGFLAGMAMIPFFKHRHVLLFDRGQPQKTWSGEPISYADLKAKARERYSRSANRPAQSSVPISKKQENRKGPWG